MKILLIVSSHHRQNTYQIAEAMSEAAPATIAELSEAKKYDLKQFDIIGFGSGIYAGKFNGKMRKFIKSLPGDKLNAFVFSTSGSGNKEYNKKIVSLLQNKGHNVLGEFGCRGFCKWFIFALVGGISKGHPDMEDFDAAQKFIAEICQKYAAQTN